MEKFGRNDPAPPFHEDDHGKGNSTQKVRIPNEECAHINIRKLQNENFTQKKHQLEVSLCNSLDRVIATRHSQAHSNAVGLKPLEIF